MNITHNIEILNTLIHKHLHRKYGLTRECYKYSINNVIVADTPVFGIYLEFIPNLKFAERIENEISIIVSSVIGTTKINMNSSVNYFKTHVWVRCYFIV